MVSRTTVGVEQADLTRVVRIDRLAVAVDGLDFRIDDAVLAERLHGLAGLRVERISSSQA